MEIDTTYTLKIDGKREDEVAIGVKDRWSRAEEL